jgi:hypothetical protein
MTHQWTDAELRAIVTAGVSIREAVKHLIIASRLLHGLGMPTTQLNDVIGHFADLAYDLDPNITPYPTMTEGLAAAAVQ